MSDRIPYFLSEAVLTLYPAAADGSALTDLPVWTGGLANRLGLRQELEEVRLTGSGEGYATAHHIDEEHVIEIESTWIVRKADAEDWRPERNQHYVLEMVWASEGHWYRRTYYGVTGRVTTWDSQRTNQFVTGQTFRAQRFVPDGGPGRPPVFTPLQAGEDQSVPFFRENPLITGEYLLGHYRWPGAARLISVTGVAYRSQTAATVLTLEVGGVLTGQTLTLPAGTANTEAQVTVDLGGVLVPYGQTVRWKITSGPDEPADAAYVASLTMIVRAE